MAVDDSYTKILLHMDGLDGGTTFTDESGKSWTRSGDARTRTSTFVFGGASGGFDGNEDYISTPDSADFDLGAGDFTFDFRIWFSSIGTSGTVIIPFQQNDFASQRAYGIQLLDGNTWRFFYTTDGTGETFTALPVTWVPTINIWYHVAIVRSETSLKYFVDGIQLGATQTLNVTIFNSNQPFEIGGTVLSSSLSLNGYMDEFRYSKGIARWTSNFQVPLTAYPWNPITFSAPPMWFM
jgi:hypothetical protein